MVGGVGRFHSELEGQLLPHAEFAHDVGVVIRRAGPAQNVAAGIAARVDSGQREGRGRNPKLTRPLAAGVYRECRITSA